MKRYILKIELDGVSPKIWRCVIVPSHISLDRLHDVIQIVMGWFDYHLHMFEFGEKSYMNSPEELEEQGVIKYSGITLETLIKKEGEKFGYLYDFGDNWGHTIILEAILEKGITLKELARHESLYGPHRLVCIDGARSCPPEDVGGVSAYKEFCRTVARPNSAKGKENLDWYNSTSFFQKPFDPKRFDMEAINSALNKYIHWSRPRTCAF
jgi:hypothetical protein